MDTPVYSTFDEAKAAADPSTEVVLAVPSLDERFVYVVVPGDADQAECNRIGFEVKHGRAPSAGELRMLEIIGASNRG